MLHKDISNICHLYNPICCTTKCSNTESLYYSYHNLERKAKQGNLIVLIHIKSTRSKILCNKGDPDYPKVKQGLKELQNFKENSFFRLIIDFNYATRA